MVAPGPLQANHLSNLSPGTCPHIIQSTSIPSPGGQIKITGHFMSRALQIIITSFTAFLAVNVVGQSTYRRYSQERWLACSATLQQPRPFTRRSPCRHAGIGTSKEGYPTTRGDETNFQIPSTRSSRDKSRFLIYMKSRDKRAHRDEVTCVQNYARLAENFSTAIVI